jgi:hypothetical protein
MRSLSAASMPMKKTFVLQAVVFSPILNIASSAAYHKNQQYVSGLVSGT